MNCLLDHLDRARPLVLHRAGDDVGLLDQELGGVRGVDEAERDRVAGYRGAGRRHLLQGDVDLRGHAQPGDLARGRGGRSGGWVECPTRLERLGEGDPRVPWFR